MANFDNIIEKSKDIAFTAAEKSQEIYKFSKLNVELAELKRKRQHNFASIGNKYYDAIKDGKDIPEFTAVIEEIDLLNAEIEEKQAIINELKDSIKTC